MITRLASSDVQRFIREQEHADEQQLVLANKTILGLPASAIAVQLAGRRKAKEKLPVFYHTAGIIYPPSTNLEQSSSEATARYKTEIIRQIIGENRRACADLTGGFGVDAFFFSQLFTEVHCIEPRAELQEIVRHNHEVLGARNLFYYVTTAEIFLERSAEKFDLVYVDPSRRTRNNKKVFRFTECEPDVTKLAPSVFERSNLLLIKASPLIDLQQGLHELVNVQEVYVVSVDNECKEILFLCRTGFVGEPMIHAVNVSGNQQQLFSFTRIQEQQTNPVYTEPQLYMYEPNSSVMKSGAFKWVGSVFGLGKLHPNTHLYTGSELKKNFPGRIFKIIATVKPEAKVVRSFFNEGQANVITRNYPLTAEALRKKTKLIEGGKQYLIAFTSQKSKQVVVAERIQ